MYFDALTTAAVAAELKRTILGGRVQRVVQTAPLSFGLEIYARGKRFHLLASAYPEHARVHLVESRPTRDPQSHSPFLLHLRRRVRGAHLLQIDSPPLERTLLLRFCHPARPANERDVTWVIEVMGRHSNLILLDREGLVIDCVKRVSPHMSPARPMLPKHPYRPPPQQTKADPRSTSCAGLAHALAGLTPELLLWQALVNLYRGVSPLLAREIVYRACGHTDATVLDACPLDRLTGELAGCWARADSDDWEPCVAFDGSRPAAFAPYRLSHRPDWEVHPLPGISQALEHYYSAIHPQTGHYQTRQVLLKALGREREQLQRRLTALQNELERASQAEVLRQQGEWLLAYQQQIEPGQRVLRVEGLEIPLDPQRSPVENARRLFAAYRKAMQARRGLPQRVKETSQALAWLDEMTALVNAAETFDEIAALATELQAAHILAPRPDVPRRKVGLAPRTFQSKDGFTILVGRNAGQNEQIAVRRAHPYDIWLHARGRPGAHVVILTEGRPVPAATLEEAASLAAYYSQGRQESRVAVDYTECRHVRRATPGRPGLVLYDHERTLVVSPAAPPPEARSDDDGEDTGAAGNER